MDQPSGKREAMLARIQALLNTLPDEIVAALVEQWEAELERLYSADERSTHTAANLPSNEADSEAKA